MSQSEYKIGLTLSTLALLRDRGIPDPESAHLEKYSVRYRAGDGSIKGDGFPAITWRWDTLSRATLWKITALLGGAASVPVYVRTRLDSGGIPTWATYTGILEDPDLAGQDGTPIPQDVRGYQNVSIRISRLVPV